MMNSNTKPRTRRASRPKVKTGCNNCKNRRVKCDETRPQCTKCVRSGRTCDGYPAYNPRREGGPPAPVRGILPAPSNRNSYPPISSSSSSSSSGPGSGASASPPAMAQIRREVRRRPPQSPAATYSLIKVSPVNSAPSISLAFDPQESLYFHIFRQHTANELSGFFDSAFWTRSVLQESHAEASIRHAVIALGALYKTLEKASESPPGSPDSNYTVDTAPNHYHFALQQYGKSIKRLQEAIASKEARPSRTILISIVLFTCFQSFIGDHTNAIGQIQSGLRMLEERRVEEQQQLIPRKDAVLENELVQMFTRLAVQAKSYDMAFHFPPPYIIKLSPENVPTSPPDTSSPSNASTSSVDPAIPEPFESLLEARAALDSLCERIIRFQETLSSHFDGPDNILPSSIRSLGTSFSMSLKNWSNAFDHLLAGRRGPGVTNTQRAGINVLKMSQLNAAVLFSGGFSTSEMHFDNFVAEFSTVVELAKEIVVDEELSLAAKKCGSTYCRHRQRAPNYSQNNVIPALFPQEEDFSHIKASFALDLGIVPPLFVVATKCRDRKLRREAIRLLMSSPRREGMWDSFLSGRAAAWIMEIEEEDLPPFNPWHSNSNDQDAADVVPNEDKRVMVKEILFDLQNRHATLRCGTRGLKDEKDYRAKETEITW